MADPIILPTLDNLSGEPWLSGRCCVMFGLPEQLGSTQWDVGQWDQQPWGGLTGWVDVTCWVRGLSVTRGRSSELETFNAGTCAIELWNEDQRFSPWNKTSPYMGGVYSNLRPGMAAAVALGKSPDLWDETASWDGLESYAGLAPGHIPPSGQYVAYSFNSAGPYFTFSNSHPTQSYTVWIEDSAGVPIAPATPLDPGTYPSINVPGEGDYLLTMATADEPDTTYQTFVTVNLQGPHGSWDGEVSWSWLFVGTVESIQDDWPGIVDSRAVYNLVDTSADLATYTLEPIPEENAPGVWAGDSTGVRIGRLMDEADWRWTRALDNGTTTVRPTMKGQTSIDLIRLTSDTEGGTTFCASDGTFCFHDLNHRPLETALVFSDDCSRGLPYYDAVMSTDTDLLVNQAMVGAQGDTPSIARDLESIRVHGVYDYARLDLINQNVAQAQRLADALVERRAFLTSRVEGFTVDTRTDRGLYPALVGLELRTFLRFERQVPNGTRMLFLLLIEGLAHNITPDVWQCTFRTSPAVLTDEIKPPIYGEEGWDVGRYEETAWSS